MRNSVLVSLAILNTNWEERQSSYLDNFVPFIADCLRKLPREEVSAQELRECVAENYALTIPYGPLEGILRRATRAGLLSRRYGIYRRDNEALSSYEIAPIRADAMRQYESLIERFRKHVRERFGLDLSAEDADASLLDYLEERSLPILSTAIRGGAEPPPVQGEGQDFLVADFISSIASSDPETFGFLVTAVKGSMLASALYFPEPGSVASSFTNLVLYLDTPFLIRVLGYGGELLEEAGKELLTSASALGAGLACWRHTLEETRGVFEACIGYLRTPNRSREALMPMVEYCLNHRISASSVEARAERLESSLSELAIEIHDPPPYHAAVSVDEVGFEELLNRRIGYRRSEALVKDLNSLTAIFRRRGGRPQTRIEAARAIFVTTNPSLVGVSREFFGQDLGRSEIPVALLDHEMATVTWLKRPVAAPDLPRKQILADCYAALYPDDELWRSYLDQVDRLREDNKLSEEDYYVLRYSVEARRALMHETLGRATAFSVGTIDEVLKKARDSARADVLREAREAAREADAQRRAAQLSESKRIQLEEDYEKKLEEAEEKTRDALRLQELHLRGIAVTRAHRVALSMNTLLMLAAIAALVTALPPPFPNPFLGLPRLIAIPLGILVLGAGILGFLNVWIGTSIRDIVGEAEGRLAGWFERRLRAKYFHDPSKRPDSLESGDKAGDKLLD